MSQEVLSYIRKFLKEKSLDGIWINSTNEYLCEYNDLQQNSRYFLTNFSGSTGDAYVTTSNVYLFVDGRYHQQADEEVDKNLITVVKLELSQTPKSAFKDIVKDNEFRIGVITSKTSVSKLESYKNEFKKIEFIEIENDPIEKFYINPDKTKGKSIHAVPVSITGTSAKEKISKITEQIGENKALLVSALDEIAYITNLRSYKIQFSSSFKAKAVIKNDKCHLFMDLEDLNVPVKDLQNENIEVHDEKSFESFIKEQNDIEEIIFCPQNTTAKTINTIEKNKIPLKAVDLSIISQMKAIKTQAEIEHMKQCFERTDAVIEEVQKWLDTQLRDGIRISEKDIFDKVSELFFKNGANALSFNTIASCGANTSIIHYSKSSEDIIVNKDDLVLIDCGAYFEGGYATDITRTFLASKNIEANELQKKVYTTVLRGFLNGLNTPTTLNTTGFDIDFKVRKIIDKNTIEGFSFAHGTGHGVGINVHEDPPRISSSEAAKAPLKPNMCFTIEPGLYKNCWGGVRLENTVYLKQNNDINKIVSFSKAAFDEKLIDFSLMSAEEIKWYKAYKEQQIDTNNQR